MRDIIIADAHLGTPNDLNYQRLLAFLKSLEGEVDTLVLLGDLFEFWSNFRTVPPSYRPLVQQLEEMSRSGTEIVWVEGNHDFHLKRYFGKQPNFRILPDGGMIHLGETPVYVAHGDLVDPHNSGYLRLRGILRSRFVAILTGFLPIPLLEKIATRMSRESKKRRRSYNRQAELEPLLEGHAAPWLARGAKAVVTGHYHTPIHKQLEQGDIISLGDWIHDFSYAEHRNGHLELRTFTD